MAKFKDTNFFDKIEVSTTAFEDSTVKWNFISIGFGLVVESSDTTDVIEYSFDGQTVHGDLTPGTPTEAIMFDNRSQCQVWFRRFTVGSPVIVRIEAWRQ
jgi:hypothetical protein